MKILPNYASEGHSMSMWLAFLGWILHKTHMFEPHQPLLISLSQGRIVFFFLDQPLKKTITYNDTLNSRIRLALGQGIPLEFKRAYTSRHKFIPSENCFYHFLSPDK